MALDDILSYRNLFSFLKKIFGNSPETTDSEFEPLGRLRGSQISSTISGAKVFADTLTLSSGLVVGQSTVITASGTIASSSLPLATTGTVGAVKTGYGLSADISGTLSVNPGSVNLTKQVHTIGDNSNTTFSIEHNLATREIVIVVLDSATNEVVLPDVYYTTTNSVTLEFGNTPTTNQYKVIIVG